MTKSRFADPYEGMSDDELDRYFSDLLQNHRNRQRSISIRFPEELLLELQRFAQQAGLGYQTLIKKLLERDVEQLRRRRSSTKRPAAAKANTRTRPASVGATRREDAAGLRSVAQTRPQKSAKPKAVA